MSFTVKVLHSEVWLFNPHPLLSTHLCKALWPLKAAVSQKGIISPLDNEQDKSGGGLTVFYRPILKIQDSVLNIPGNDALFFPQPAWRA